MCSAGTYRGSPVPRHSVYGKLTTSYIRISSLCDRHEHCPGCLVGVGGPLCLVLESSALWRLR